MKLERLLTMIMILINRKKVTAQELAEVFNVSVRTIYRDIETLSCAGVPVISQQGAHGGISLIDGYRVDKQILTKDELASLTIAIKSALTTYEDSHAEAVLEKLTSIADDHVKQSMDHLFIDLSPWGPNILFKEHITILKSAIENRHCVSFNYSTTHGELTRRVVEPHTLVQKGKTWYLYGYCTLRMDFRLFKLARIKNLMQEDLHYERKEINLSELPWGKEWYQPQNVVDLVISFDMAVTTLVEESFGVEFVNHKQAKINISIPEDEWLYGFLLSFGNRIKVIEPPHIRDILQKRAQEIVQVYKIPDNS
ncbi:YafY family transcriptional regulator [Lysinibacillus fusiformis]|uniref:helix-turn-helix transcriptional regulator n=1 Tax=Lysinibacillus fusiformis TaxID=28031 RepID=UPI0011BB41B2|nr:YafY family protein [Lysinibacillus fusiformis]QDZ97783.1 YafY family transcriptional regulator [Lysinibacillus fusiformis]